ncbi:MAG: hypothetical protein WA960_01235 [Tunicatimonas sp.]
MPIERRIEADIPVLGKVYVNFVNLASQIYALYEKEKEVDRQKDMPHLGLISRASKGINHSRYEYLVLQCVISELVENNFKGTTSAQGSITVDGVKYFGNDIIKTWFLLSNFGHCKNTIGDEKALLLRAVQNRGFKSYLLKPLKEDEELKPWAEGVINDFDYLNFHHILAIIRVYKCLPRKLNDQKKIITIYKLLLLDSSLTSSVANQLQVEQLKLIHSNIRSLAILALDSRNSSLPISIDILSTILSFDFYENRYQQTKTSEIFNPMLSMLYDMLYLNPKSQTYHRAYELKASATLLNRNHDACLKEAIESGLANPDDCNLSHFLRTELHIDNVADKNIGDALRKSLTVKREVQSVEASVDYNPFTLIRVMDFYMQRTFQPNDFPKFLTNIARILEDETKGTIKGQIDNKGPLLNGLYEGMRKINLTEDDENVLQDAVEKRISSEALDQITKKNIPVFKEILWSVLKHHLKDRYYFDIDHHTSKEYNYFGVKFSPGIDLLTKEVEQAIEQTENRDRQHELRQLLKSANRKFEGTTIACLSRTTIYDYSKAPSQRKVTDIDSLLLKFNSDEMILELHESKNTKASASDAKKDLKDKLTKTLNNSKGYRYRIVEVKNMGAKIVIKHST